MKNITLLSFIFITIFTGSCSAQKLVQTVPDAFKLKEHVKEFMGKPLTNLLEQIIPEPKFVYGNTAVESSRFYLTFYFISKKEYFKSNKEGSNPIHIRVVFEKPKKDTVNRIPVGGIEWGREDLQKYGNLLIQSIHVSGDKDT